MIGTYYRLSLADEDVGADKAESNSMPIRTVSENLIMTTLQMDVMKGANTMSAGILDGFQTIIPTAAAVLSEKRQMLRLTQQEIADRAKITLRQYQRLESGERSILTCSFGLACRVVEALDMDVSKFYHGDYYLEELKTIEGKRFGDRGKHQFK